MSEAEQHRLFVALRAPEEVKEQVEKAQAELRRAVPQARVTWTRREQFHLTLKFLGNVEGGRVAGLVEVVRGACHGFAPLRLRAQGVGCFPAMRAPRVVWLGVTDGQEALPRLQRAIELASAGFTGLGPDQRFSGHVTLGRIKSIARAEAESLGSKARAMAETFFGEWTAGQVEIMRSELSSEGARHTILATVALAG
jgi:2'-5' RNA ligase